MRAFPLGRRRLLILALLVVLVGGGGYLAWREYDRGTEQFVATCSLPDQQRCNDTVLSITQFPDLALQPRPQARVDAVHLRPAPEAWAGSADPSYRHAGWSAEITLSSDKTIVAPCHYFSDWMVACALDELAPTGG